MNLHDSGVSTAAVAGCSTGSSSLHHALSIESLGTKNQQPTRSIPVASPQKLDGDNRVVGANNCLGYSVVFSSVASPARSPEQFDDDSVAKPIFVGPCVGVFQYLTYDDNNNRF